MWLVVRLQADLRSWEAEGLGLVLGLAEGGCEHGWRGKETEDQVEGELSWKSEDLDFEFKFYQVAGDHKYVIFLLCVVFSASVPGLLGMGVGQMDVF